MTFIVNKQVFFFFFVMFWYLSSVVMQLNKNRKPCLLKVDKGIITIPFKSRFCWYHFAIENFTVWNTKDMALSFFLRIYHTLVPCVKNRQEYSSANWSINRIVIHSNVLCIRNVWQSRFHKTPCITWKRTDNLCILDAIK